jgi:hypothetical protein
LQPPYPYPSPGYPGRPVGPPRPPPSRLPLVIAIIAGLVVLAFVGLVVAYRAPIMALIEEPEADVHVTKEHDADGLYFDYPGNWSHEAETTNESGIVLDAITVESPGSCIAVVQRFRAKVDADPSRYARAFSDALNNQKAKTGGLIGSQEHRSENFDGKLAGKPAKGQRVHVVVTAVGEKVPTTLEVLVRAGDEHTLVLVTSCPDEDLPKSKPGFELIRDTMKLDEP